MSLTEQERHQLHRDLEQAIGSESAGNLMSHLPPIGWADFATKSDLEMLRVDLKGEFGELRGEFYRAINSQTKGLFFAVAGLNLTLTGLVVAALRVA